VFDQGVAIDPAAARRSTRSRVAWRSSAVVAPDRGTWLALGLLVAGGALLGAVLLTQGLRLQTSAATALALAVGAAFGERIAIPLGPRTWYTPSTPVIVLAGLLCGPAGGALVAVAAQLGPAGGAWRRRVAQTGIGCLQGVIAGLVGVALPASPTGAVIASAAALGAAVAVNTGARVLVLRARRITPFGEALVRGLLVDLVDAAVAVPILAALVVVAADAEALAVAVAVALLVALTIAHEAHRAVTSALAAEERNARRDALTGAPNRFAFEEMLARQHARTLRGDQPAGVFVVDVDRFKSINDRFGHEVGDAVLAEIVRRLSEGLRASDVVARWGGEELTILAPGLRGQRALEQYGERVRRLVSDLPVTAGRVAIQVTVSVGGTLLDGSLSATAALRRADGAMYEAKRTRDRSVVVPPPRVRLHSRSA
jgi:diguanylate cyclase (GGDEF)-like protein